MIPIMLRPCDVEETPIERLQQLPEGGRPITKWGNRDEACQDVAKRLRIVVEEWTSLPLKRTASTDPPKPTEKERDQSSVLQRVFGFGRSVTVAWMRMALDRGAAVARIVSRSGRPMGTGFLVDSSEFGLHQIGAPLLLTGSFVITPEAKRPVYGGLPPEQALAQFQIAGIERGVKSVIWSSPVGKLFTILVTLDGPVRDVQPLRVAEPRSVDDPTPPRVVVIGHPGGADVEFSLTDTQILDRDDVRVHYRAATQPGSSGSAVLTYERLDALAIHTSRRTDMRRLHDQSGTYEACEGILLEAIRKAIVTGASQDSLTTELE